ncbi:MAG: hypothetical protein ABJP48_11600 [Erythrobacter sp.]
MAYRRLFGTSNDRVGGTEGNAAGELEGAPLGGTRSEAMQRLQVGVSGLGAMVLLVGLASVIQNRVLVSEGTTVPQAAPTTEPTVALPQNDPLADAGVVPDLPAEPDPVPTQEAAIVPEQGTREIGDQPAVVQDENEGT